MKKWKKLITSFTSIYEKYINDILSSLIANSFNYYVLGILLSKM